ncbi:DUF11 domain-containing protein, partial [Candidatus Saccharibacteria bacterium]|nr:DUF11 domain-containing protein [Candidatus Saccharibacteria bacterium]
MRRLLYLGIIPGLIILIGGALLWGMTSKVGATNFVVTNLNNSGSGSLRQAIIDVNSTCQLGSSHVISFQFAPSLPHQSYGTDQVYQIRVGSELPIVNCPNTIVDGFANNPNQGLVGSSQVAGVDQIVVRQVRRPFVEIVDTADIDFGLQANVDQITIRGISIYGFGKPFEPILYRTANIRLQNSHSSLVMDNLVGCPASGAIQPPAGYINYGSGIYFFDSNQGTIQNNIVCANKTNGIDINVGSISLPYANFSIKYNQISDSGGYESDHIGDGIWVFGSTNALVEANHIVNSAGAGIDGVRGSQIINNTTINSGLGNEQTNGISVLDNGSLVKKNIVTKAKGSGILVYPKLFEGVSGNIQNQISQNSTYDNGSVGIDLVPDGVGNPALYQDGQTLNDLGDQDKGGNNLLNFPVIEKLVVDCSNSKALITGWSRPGANLELFRAALDPTGFGEGKDYLASYQEGNSLDLDSRVSSYGPGVVNGLLVGQDQTNRFGFYLDLSQVSATNYYTMTATVAGSTSEFSQSVRPEYACIGLAKQVDSIQSLGSGKYQIGFDFSIKNYFDQALNNLSLVDNLLEALSGLDYQVLELSSGQLDINPSYNGGSDQEILAPDQGLSPGQTAQVHLEIEVQTSRYPDSFGLHHNQATLSAQYTQDQAVLSISDQSQVGVDPDPDQDGNPGNNSQPTDFGFDPKSSIGLAKSLSSVDYLGQASFELKYQFVIKNYGDTWLDDLELIEDLGTQFGTVDWQVMEVISPNLVVNTTYNGIDQQNLLAPAQSLAPGQSAQISLRLQVKTPDGLEILVNTAEAQAIDIFGDQIGDSSVDGLDPDANGDGDPGNDTSPTSWIPDYQPKIGLAKELTQIEQAGADYIIHFRYHIKNFSDYRLKNLKLIDRLDIWLAGLDYQVVSLTSPDLTINNSFGQNADWNMLAGIDNLEANQTRWVDLKLRLIRPKQIEFANQAEVRASFGNQTLSDYSNAGSEIDPDNNQDPTNNDQITEWQLGVDLSLSKQVSQAWVKLGDSLEYQLVATNSSQYRADNIEIKDYLPAGIELLNYQASAGSYNQANNIWSLPALSAGQVEVLQLQVKVVGQYRDYLNQAEIVDADQLDIDSVYNNFDFSEDDADQVNSSLIEADPNQNYLSGFVFFDTNNNSQPDIGEIGIDGLGVVVTLPDGSTQYLVTNNGWYQYQSDQTGIFQVAIDQQSPNYPTDASLTTGAIGGLENQLIDMAGSGNYQFKPIGYYQTDQVEQPTEPEEVTPAQTGES